MAVAALLAGTLAFAQTPLPEDQTTAQQNAARVSDAFVADLIGGRISKAADMMPARMDKINDRQQNRALLQATLDKCDRRFLDVVVKQHRLIAGSQYESEDVLGHVHVFALFYEDTRLQPGESPRLQVDVGRHDNGKYYVVFFSCPDVQ